MHQRALDGYRASDVDYGGSFETLSSLGEILCLRGDLDEAESMYQTVLESQTNFSSDPFLMLQMKLRTRHRLANLYREKGNLEKAELGYHQVIAGFELKLGPQHRDTLEAVDDLGVLFLRTGRLKEAQTMFDRAFHGFKENLGLQHTCSLRAVLHLGNLQAMRKDFKAASELYSQASMGLQAKHGTSHYLYLQALTHTANIFKLQGRKGEAVATYYQVLHGLERIYGSQHPETLEVLANLNKLQRGPTGLIDRNNMILLSTSLVLLSFLLFANMS